MAHPLLEEAKRAACVYRVRPSERGFHVWCFQDWSSPQGGWRVVVADVRDQVDGWMHVLHLLGLLAYDPPAPLPPAQPKARPDAEWF